MTKPTRSFDTNFGRFYSHPASGAPSAIGLIGVEPGSEGPYAPKPSVTNIIRIMDEGFLPNHYAKLVAEHAVNNLDAIRYSVEKFGPDIAVGSLKAVPSRPNPAAAIGDEVHDAIDDYVHGTIRDPALFSTTTARQMFAQFKNFMEVEKPEVLASEFTIWSYKHGYAGTGDLLWKWRDLVWLVDSKTGNRCYPKVAMQCGALAMGCVILDASGNELPMPHTDKLGAFHIRPRSAKLYELQHPNEAFAAFLGLKTVFDWMRFFKESTIPDVPLVRTELRAA